MNILYVKKTGLGYLTVIVSNKHPEQMVWMSNTALSDLMLESTENPMDPIQTLVYDAIGMRTDW